MARILALAAVLFLACTGGLAGRAAADGGTVGMTSAEKQAMLLSVFEKFVPFAESFWRSESDIVIVSRAEWPSAFSSTDSEPGYPPGNANDGDEDTFWVACGTTCGAREPVSEANPQILGVDFGAPTTFDSVTVTPRTRYGPNTYAVETSDDGTSWNQVAQATGAPDSTHTTSFAPTEARMVRIRVTESWDERTVQIRTFAVRSGSSEDLALNPPVTTPAGIPRTGSFLATGPGVSQPRGDGEIAFLYATLLYAKPDQQTFGGVSRATMLDHAIQAIRHEAHTNATVLANGGTRSPDGEVAGPWGGGSWQAALETYYWAYAAKVLWSELDDDTRSIVRQVVTNEANILLDKPPATATPGDTGAEENAWNAPLPVLAAVMFPDHPNASAWVERSKLFAMNSVSRAADAQSPELVDGVPVSTWMQTVNLFDDFTLQNHGFFNPIYVTSIYQELASARVFAVAGNLPIPQAFDWRLQTLWDKVLLPLNTDDGDTAMPAGQDWTSKDYQMLNNYSLVATVGQDMLASVAESRALRLIAKRQALHSNGSFLGQSELGYEASDIGYFANAWWVHHYFGPSPQPTTEQYNQARADASGVYEYPHGKAIVARTGEGMTTMSWDARRPMGLVIPWADEHEDDPIFTAYVPGSLVGSASGTVGPNACECRNDRFSTAGTIGNRQFSMSAFPDGLTMLLDRGTGRTFNLGFELIPGLTGDRPVYSAGGESRGDLTGTWANVADRLGMAVAGGGGFRATDVLETENPYLSLVGSTSTGTGNRGAVILPNADRGTTAEVASTLVQPDVPDGWSALFARAADGTDRLAVARWGGADNTALRLSDPRGAPVTTAPSIVDGTTATSSWSLSSPRSTAEIVRFLIETNNPLQARALDENRAELVNEGGKPVKVRVTYVGDDGKVQKRSRGLAPGKGIVARLVDGRLTLAGRPTR